MKVSYEGVAEQVATFQVDRASNPAVQAAALTVGYAQLALDSSSKLAAGTGRGGLVVEVDGGTCGVIFC